MNTFILFMLGFTLLIKLIQLVVKKKSERIILKKKGNLVFSNDVESLLIN